MPLILGLIDQLKNGKISIKIDLKGAYNKIQIRKRSEWKTTFRVQYGHFECNVMPYGLTNALVVFQNMMNNVFQEFLDIFVIIYIDGILIFSKSKKEYKEHKEHICLVLQKLHEMGLNAKLEKCTFHQFQVEFLGYIRVIRKVNWGFQESHPHFQNHI